MSGALLLREEEGYVEVPTGEVRASNAGKLGASALASCVAVVVHDEETSVGGMAHIMLPGRCVDGRPIQRTRFAEDGVRELLWRVTELGADASRLVAHLVGGANVLDDGDDALGRANVRAATEQLARHGIRLRASQVGGVERRSATLEVSSGRVYFTVGESDPAPLDPCSRQEP